eukprot:CAMPEP_0204605034 /NCGR_PEP_ID=MMETSP0661-20131031/58244_1 /ASSEMBLY_ACC=CAM_ASM_000606 /TAXON_ID=109239 /ORGANISM="Alexandrium margalefi, Strain AMGDE01CS-322" /LENGTH=58 /DNA_ID=CAMNT_0051616245 /DNA_START=72 /DNA_END=248 /DNA_ORIENTATION=-
MQTWRQRRRSCARKAATQFGRQAERIEKLLAAWASHPPAARRLTVRRAKAETGGALPA